MPTLDFSLKRMCDLVGKDLTIPQLEDDLQWIALDIEGIDYNNKIIRVIGTAAEISTLSTMWSGPKPLLILAIIVTF